MCCNFYNNININEDCCILYYIYIYLIVIDSSLLSEDFIPYGPQLKDIKIENMIPFSPYSSESRNDKDGIYNKISMYGNNTMKEQLKNVFILSFILYR